MRTSVWSVVVLVAAGACAVAGPNDEGTPAGGGGTGGALVPVGPGSGGAILPSAGGFSGGGAPPIAGGMGGMPSGGAAPSAGGDAGAGGGPSGRMCGTVFRDCNGDPADSCETNTTSDPLHCGECGSTCPPGANARPSCFVGECDFFCESGWGDCDGEPENGCEQDLRSDPANCGLCGMSCGDSTCQNGGCECASSSETAEKIPLHIYVLFDQSLSMQDPVQGGSKWNVIRGALTTFVQAPESAGISVGIGYFPFQVPDPPLPCFMNADCGNYGPCMGAAVVVPGVCQAADPCTAQNYEPDVPIALLPGVSGAIVGSLNAHVPGGFTPTYAALQGTYPYVQSWAEAHPNDKTILVLATDGDPTTCDGNTNNVNTIANNLVAPARNAAPPILTFVIGVGSSLTSLNQIAAAGGTQTAFIVDTAGADPGGQFLAAMKAIEGSVLLGCQYQIPAPAGGAPVDFSKVNVRYTPSGGSPALLRNVANAAACAASADGWYYDNPSAPTQIILCDSICGDISGGATVEIVLGCATIG